MFSDLFFPILTWSLKDIFNVVISMIKKIGAIPCISSDDSTFCHLTKIERNFFFLAKIAESRQDVANQMPHYRY